MRARVAALSAAVLLFFCFLVCARPAMATEDESAFVSPTRDPNASEYSNGTPELLEPGHIVADSYVLMERTTKQVLYEKNMNKANYPASTTKIMTALLALELGELDETLEVSEDDVTLPDNSSVVPFKAGEVVTLKDALYGMMLRSGNEAANAVARHVGGDIDSFVALMNQTAQMIGCTSTNFVNPNGLHDPFHVSSAFDLALILDAALNNPVFRQIIATPRFSLSATEKNIARQIDNSNAHLFTELNGKDNVYYYAPSIGGKTGFTSDAGYVLVEAAKKGGVELIAVIMYSGQYSRWPDTKRLFEYGFSQYSSTTPEEIYAQAPTVMQVSGFDEETERARYTVGGVQDVTVLGRLLLELVPVEASRKVTITGLNSEVEEIKENFNKFIDVRWVTEPRAPIEKGQVMGILTYYPSGEEEARYELRATRSIAARKNAPPTLEEIEARVAADPSVFPPFDLTWALPPMLIGAAALYALRLLLKRLFRRRKKKRQIPRPKRRYFG